VIRASLDTCVFDWILDQPRGPELLDRLQAGDVEVAVFPEVSKELHDVPETKADRRGRLLAILKLFLPVRPTRIPLAGLARAGAMRVATRAAAALRQELRHMGFRKLDSLHLINAHLERCSVFLTTDKEDILRRKAVLEARLGLQILSPQEFLDRYPPSEQAQGQRTCRITMQ
jgi:hypothetical protein